MWIFELGLEQTHCGARPDRINCQPKLDSYQSGVREDWYNPEHVKYRVFITTLTNFLFKLTSYGKLNPLTHKTLQQVTNPHGTDTTWMFSAFVRQTYARYVQPPQPTCFCVNRMENSCHTS